MSQGRSFFLEYPLSAKASVCDLYFSEYNFTGPRRKGLQDKTKLGKFLIFFFIISFYKICITDSAQIIMLNIPIHLPKLP